MTPAAQLYALPEPVQEGLCRLVRTAAGMSQAEKVAAMEAFVLCASHLVAVETLDAPQFDAPLAVLSDVVRLLAEASRQAEPRAKEMV